MKPLHIATLLLPALLAIGCSREAEDWRSAQSADTPESYATFLKQHADSAQAATATTRMEQLAEERDWQLASSEDSSQAYQNFVAQHPEGKWAKEARIRVENFTLNQSIGPVPGATETPEEPTGKPNPAAVAGPHPANPPAPSAVAGVASPTPPVPAHAAPAHAAPAHAAPAHVATAAESRQPARLAAAKPVGSKVASTGYGVQLGAFSSEAKAQSQWQSLSGKFHKELGGQSHHVATGKSAGAPVYRLQVARASEQQARALCADLAAKGQSCTVVLP